MIFAIIAILAYLSALFWIVPTVVRLEQHAHSDTQPNVKAVLFISFIAVVAHFINLGGNVIENAGLNFTVANVASLMSVLMSLIASVALLKWRTVWFPLIIVYVLGICAVSVSSFVTGSVIKQLQQTPGLLFHLGIAIFSYALFAIALMYAFQLKWLDDKLKNKKMLFCSMLPPLMTVERHFFTLTLAAQSLLTVTLVSGMFYLHNFFAPEQVNKAIFSFIAWLIYAIQLLGQWKLHWRGKRVIIYSLSGMILLTIGYFGSRF